MNADKALPPSTYMHDSTRVPLITRALAAVVCMCVWEQDRETLHTITVAPVV